MKLQTILTVLLLIFTVSSLANEDDFLTEEEQALETEEQEEIEKMKDPLLVSLKDFGELRGFEDVSSKGKKFFSFTGIPYAAAPVGKLRFKNPQLYPGWEGIRNFTSMPEPCPQFDVNQYLKEPLTTYVGKEDCLFLNVYTPKTHSKELLPVLIYLHGGSYMSGKASDYLPHEILNEDVILVVLQFRMGVLGYLSTEDLVIPGNLGLKDQTMSFRWITRYIENFGGDSFKATLFGSSSGSAMAHLHTLSHHNLGFFKRAILQSGTGLCPWAMGGVHKQAAHHLGRRICEPRKVPKGTEVNENSKENKESVEEGERSQSDKGEEDKKQENEDRKGENQEKEEEQQEDMMTSEELLECLQNADVEYLTMSIQEFFQWGISPTIFGPYVDGRFLVSSPEWLLQQGRHKRLDMIVGINREDGGAITNAMFANEGRRNMLQQQFPLMGPIAMEFTSDDVAPFNMTLKVFDKYVGGLGVEEENADNLTKLFTDRHFAVCSDTTAFLHHKNNLEKKLPVFFYEMHHKGERSTSDLFENNISKNWITNGDEVAYLFPNLGSSTGGEPHQMNDEDRKVSETMIKMWVNFANTGNPTPDDSLGFEWEPFTRDSPQHLTITTQPHMHHDRRNETRKFWNSMPTKQNILLHEENFPEIMEFIRKENEKKEKKEKELNATKSEMAKDEL